MIPYRTPKTGLALKNQTLETLCVDKITKVIWYSHGIAYNLQELANVVGETKKKDVSFKSVLKRGKHTFQDSVELILNKIMTMHYYPYKLKMMIALRFISLEEHFSRSILELSSMLKKPNVHNIIYCIDNAVIRYNKLDKVETLRRVLFNSYFRVKLKNKITKFCSIDADDFDDNYNSFVSRKEAQIRGRKMAFMTCSWEYVWLHEVMYAYGKNWQDLKYVEKHILDHIAANGPLEILELQYNKLKVMKIEYVVSRALISALLSDEDVKENIIFLFTKLKSETKIKIFMRYHNVIFDKLFKSYCGDFCFDVFTEIYRYNRFDTCTDICYNALCLLTSGYKCDGYYYDVLYTNCKYIFFNMWKMLPDSNKLKLGDKFYMMLDLSTQIKDLDILSFLITDPTFNDQQKFEHRVYVFSKIVLESNLDETGEKPLKDAFERLAYLEKCKPDGNIAWIKNNMNSKLLKKLILTANGPNIKALKKIFENDTLEKCLQNELLTDSAFIHEALIKISEFEPDDVIEFLDWIFGEDKMSFKRYVQQNVVPHLVDIYKSYVLQSRWPSLFPFSHLNVTEEDQGNIKAVVREDTEFIGKLFAKFLCPCVRLCYRNTSFLFKAIYNDDEPDEEILQLIQNHLISENGLDSIYKMFESEFYSVRLYLNNPSNSPAGSGFVDTMKYYCEFSKSWLKNNTQIINALMKAMVKRGYPSTLKKLEDCNFKDLLLPFESIRDNRVIVNANYRMFLTIIQIKTYRLDANLKYIKEDSKRISSLSDYSEEFEPRGVY